VIKKYHVKDKVVRYICNCKCGTKGIIITEKELKHKKSCGCLKKKKGFNEYKIIGDTTIIYFTNRYDEIINEGYIDTEDLQMLIDLDYHWCADLYRGTRDYYAKYIEFYKDQNNETKKKVHCLHREIMHVHDKYIKVDHREHNTLDNRKINLRVTNNQKNTRNRKGKNSNNKSGFRNVSKQGKWWVVQLQIEGKNTILKKFPLDQVDEAGVYAELMRQKYYGEFAGKN
jgi:hypothetical protein